MKKWYSHCEENGGFKTEEEADKHIEGCEECILIDKLLRSMEDGNWDTLKCVVDLEKYRRKELFENIEDLISFKSYIDVEYADELIDKLDSIMDAYKEGEGKLDAYETLEKFYR